MYQRATQFREQLKINLPHDTISEIDGTCFQMFTQNQNEQTCFFPIRLLNLGGGWIQPHYVSATCDGRGKPKFTARQLRHTIAMVHELHPLLVGIIASEDQSSLAPR